MQPEFETREESTFDVSSSHSRVIMHHSYHREGRTDVTVLQRNAIHRRDTAQTPTVIHYHSKEGFPGWPDCRDVTYHELYMVGANINNGKGALE
jgi:hypothetical protein